VTEDKEKGETGINPPGAGVNAPKMIDIEKIFDRAEHARHREHAEEVLSELVRKEIEPLMGDGFVDYSEEYDDFPLLVEWWDYDEEGRFGWAGTLQYFLKYFDFKTGKYYSDKELAHEVNEIRKDLVWRMKERDEWAKELEKRLEADEQ